MKNNQKNILGGGSPRILPDHSIYTKPAQKGKLTCHTHEEKRVKPTDFYPLGNAPNYGDLLYTSPAYLCHQQSS